MMARNYRLLDSEVLDLAIEEYFAFHPDLDPATTSVQLVRDGLKYRAIGHETIAQPVGYPVPAAGQVDIPIGQLAEDAFIAYGNRIDWSNHTMDVAEGWENQGPQVVAGFEAAAAAVRDRVLGRPLPEAAPGLAHLPRLAEGGVVNSTPMMIGE